MQILFRLFRESVLIALLEITGNRLRSFLSLTGITIGIFCIIAVFSAVDSLKSNIEESFEALGNDILYVQKWPLVFTQDYPWWKYVKRPEVSEEELDVVRTKSRYTANAALSSFGARGEMRYRDKTLDRVEFVGVSDQYDQLRDLDFNEGRFFTELEFHIGKKGVVLGAKLAEELFPGEREIVGREVKVRGYRMVVVGVLESEGDFLFDLSLDGKAIIPWNTFTRVFDDRYLSPVVMVRTRDGVSPDDHMEELRGIMRQHRRIRPAEEDNFAINRISIFIDQMQNLFRIVNVAGLFIGIFSILVGGFGIANIMFVSVKERTSIIGIKKALGARQLYILLEFLVESVVLCSLGGIVGLLMVFVVLDGVEWAMAEFTDSNFDFFVSFFNVSLGIAISVFTGLTFGFVPAYRASRMKPVDAIRSK